MRVEADTAVIKGFRDLIDARKDNENEVQAYLEENTALIVTPHLRHHDLHMNCLISKFPMGDRTPDFAYLTKSSNAWTLVLVELESPAKKLFLKSGDHVSNTAKFNAAMDQIKVWKEYWRREKAEVIKSLDALLVPAATKKNDMALKFVLVIGRSSEMARNQARRDRLVTHEADDLAILTYDTLLDNYVAGRGERRCILSPKSKGFAIKNVDGDPKYLFSDVYPEHLNVTPDVGEELKQRGYDIDSWRQDKLLTHDGRWLRDDTATIVRKALEKMVSGSKKAV